VSGKIITFSSVANATADLMYQSGTLIKTSQNGFYYKLLYSPVAEAFLAS
jgi:hypothetical protein